MRIRLFVMSLVMVIFPAAAQASEEGAAAKVWKHAKLTAEGAFDATGLEILAAGAVAALVASNSDQAMHDDWVNHQRMSADISHIGDLWGRGIAEAAIAGAQLIWDREHGIVDVEGLAGATIVTEALKLSTQRARPDSERHNSFPSGHTQVSFASATNLAMSYGWKAGVPAYGMAVLTGLSRLADDAHWLSDVVFGATVGIVFGRAGFSHHFNVTPMAIDDGGNGGGLLVSWKF